MSAATHAARLRASVVNGESNPARATNLSLGAAFVATINAIVALFVAFGLPISAQQEASIGVAVNSVVILLVALSHFYGQREVERESPNGRGPK